MEIVKFNENLVDGVYLLETLAYKSPWTKQNFIDELSNQYSKMFVLIQDDLVLGYVGAWQVLDNADITKVTILPNLKNKGLGKYIFSFMMNNLLNDGVKQINLEVRKSNAPAIHLYEKFGFKKISERKKYYADGEDALIYVYLKEGEVSDEKIYLGA